MFKRYAVYFTPAAQSDLARFGARWLGWDSAMGRAMPHASDAAIDLATITETPRKYGFHATLKPPFRLAEGATEDELHAALETFGKTHRPVQLQGLELRRLGGFLALCPTGDVTDLQNLAASVVRDFDMFRAPLTEAEMAKRRASNLTPEQDALLVEWGYPFVMEAFRFHMTLSGRLKDDLLEAAKDQAQTALNGITLAPYDLDGLTLLGERADGYFEQIARVPLNPAA